jgi:hypothetical protein
LKNKHQEGDKAMKIRLLILTIVTVSYNTAIGSVGVVTFEEIPSSTPTDGMVISNQFLGSHGISFSLANGQHPILAQTGAPQTAFAGPPTDTGPDMPAENQAVGSFFLTDDGVVSGPPSDLIISYLLPDKAASGVILDVDGVEEWTVEALGVSTQVLDSVVIASGDLGTGDGIATFWSFDRPTKDIYFIRLRYSASQIQGGVGLAFDNFSPSSVFNPTTVDVDLYTAIELAWFAITNVSYQVQYSTELGPTNWINFGSPVIGNDATNYIFDTTRNNSNKFYRVILDE